MFKKINKTPALLLFILLYLTTFNVHSQCTPPSLNIETLPVCVPDSVDLNDAIGSGSDPANLSFYNSQTEANNAVNDTSAMVYMSGSYWIRAEDPNDATCFQVYEVVVTVAPVIEAGSDQTSCESEPIILTANNPTGASISWNNGISDGVSFIPSVTDTYIVTATVGTCTSNDQVVVTAAQTVNSNDTQATCGPFSWGNGITYPFSNHLAIDTIFNGSMDGCDSVVALDLTVSQTETTTDVVFSCYPFEWIDGITYTSSNNTAIANVTNPAGCNSTVFLDLTILDKDTLEIDTTVCADFIFNNKTYDSSGVYIDTIFHLNTFSPKNINFGTSQSVSPSANAGYGWGRPSLYWDYTPDGAAVSYGGGQFSMMRLSAPFWTGNGNVNNSIVNQIGVWDTSIPNNEWFGSTFTINVPANGTYYVMLVGDNSFRFSLDGAVQITSDPNQIVIAEPVGSDPVSTVVFHWLHIYPIYLTEGCHTIRLEGNNDGGAGMFGGAILNNSDVEIANATQNSDLNYLFSTENVTTFFADPPTFSCPAGFSPLGPTFCDQCISVECDEIIKIELEIDSITSTDVQISCGPYLWGNGITYPFSNHLAIDTIFNGSAEGCDSVVTLDLTVSHEEESTDVIYSCDPFTWIDGNTYTSDNNTATTTLTNPAGCNSTVTLDLTMVDNDTLEIDTTLCAGESLIYNGKTYDSSGVYLDTLSSSDSTAPKIIDFGVSQTVSPSANPGYGWGRPSLYWDYTPDGAAVSYGGGQFSMMRLSAPFWTGNGNVNNSIVNQIGVWDTSIPSNQWFGSTFTIDVPASGTYYVMLVGDNSFRFSLDGAIQITSDPNQIVIAEPVGSDPISTVVFHWLHIYPIYLDEGCHTITLEGNNDGGSGMFGGAILDNSDVEIANATQNSDLTYLFSTENVTTFYADPPTFSCPLGMSPLGPDFCDECISVQCDKIVKIELEIDSFTTENHIDSICDGDTYTLHGFDYNTADFYEDTLKNAEGCDSIRFTLDLSIINPITSTDIQSACDSYTWMDGNTYTSNNNTATFTIVGGAATGCDSIIILDLTVNPQVPPIFDPIADFCVGTTAPTLPGTSTNGIDGTWNPLTIDNSTAGTTTYTFTPDAGECATTQTVDVTVNPSPTYTTATTAPSCGNSDGEIVIIPGSGFTITNYSIDNGTSTQAGGTFSNLAAGSYNLVIIDANGCEAIGTENLNNTVGPTIDNISSTDASCGADDGTITVTASGGATPLSYALNNGQTSTNGTFTGLADGNYTVIVTDANGCSTNQTITVGKATGPILTIVNSENVSCFGESNGSAEVNTTGGTAPYTYDWSPVGENANTATGLAPGTYTVTVNDDAGCSNDLQIIISEPDEITIDKTITPSVCDLDNGGIALTVTGGSGNYTYTWDPNVSTTEEATDLAIGTYKVTVTDDNGCSQTISYNVPLGNSFYTEAIPDSITILQGGSVDIHLFIDPNITVDNIIWTPTDGLSCSDCVAPIATPEHSTTYIVTVTDENGCTSTDTVKINVVLPCADIFVPNTFSPNSDGLNDLECVLGKCIVSLDFTIFNRWGETIFKTLDQNECWDGRFRGKLVQSGVYVYKLNATLENGQKVERTGNITVVR